MARGISLDILDGLSSSVAIKGSCACATTGNVVLAGEQTIDGVLTAESRVLVKAQTDSRENGIYATSTGDWRRTADFSRNNDVVPGTLVIVAGGTLTKGLWSTAFTAPLSIDTTAITFDNVLTAAGGVSLASLTAILADYVLTANLSALLADVALSGHPTAPTPDAGDNDNSIATTAFVQGELASSAIRIKRIVLNEIYGAG